MGLNPIKVHFYADDCIIYTVARSLQVAMDSLPTAVNLLQVSLVELKLVLNCKKTNFMTFTCSHSLPTDCTISQHRIHLEKIISHKYLGMWIDGMLTFDVHIDSLLRRKKTTDKS